MKNLFSRFVRLIAIKFREVVLRFENPIKVMEYKLNETQNIMKEMKLNIQDMQAKRNILASEVKKDELELVNHREALDLAVKQNDEERGAQLIIVGKKCQARLDTRKEQLIAMDEMITVLNKKRATLNTKYQASKADYEMFKSEYEFAKSMGKVNDQMRTVYSDDIDLSELAQIKSNIRKDSQYQVELSKVVAADDDKDNEIEDARTAFLEYKKNQELKKVDVTKEPVQLKVQ